MVIILWEAGGSSSLCVAEELARRIRNAGNKESEDDGCDRNSRARRRVSPPGTVLRQVVLSIGN